MGKCRYDILKDCDNKDCLKCMLDKIRAEIEERKKNSGGEPNRDIAFNVCLQIIDKYMAEEDKA